MKTQSALSALLCAAVLVPAAACDKGDKKSDTTTTEGAKPADPADVPMMGHMVMPTMIMTADVTVDAVGSDGTMSNKVVFGPADVKDTKDSMPGIADAMKQQLGKMKGIAMTMAIAPNGQVKDFKLDASS